jgi:predicted enzyme related to lactoylglutathione lyase
MRAGISFLVIVLVVTAVVFSHTVIAMKYPPGARQVSKATDAAAPKYPQTQEMKKAANLRAPGFAFMELYTKDVTGYVDFFHKVAGFEATHVEPGYAQVQSDHGEFIFNGGDGAFGGKLNRDRGIGVEIGIVVADLDKSFAAAEASGWKISSKIKLRPWGVRDFRVFTPDGYYLRFTEGPK